MLKISCKAIEREKISDPSLNQWLNNFTILFEIVSVSHYKVYSDSTSLDHNLKCVQAYGLVGKFLL